MDEDALFVKYTFGCSRFDLPERISSRLGITRRAQGGSAVHFCENAVDQAGGKDPRKQDKAFIFCADDFFYGWIPPFCDGGDRLGDFFRRHAARSSRSIAATARAARSPYAAPAILY